LNITLNLKKKHLDLKQLLRKSISELNDQIEDTKDFFHERVKDKVVKVQACKKSIKHSIGIYNREKENECRDIQCIGLFADFESFSTAELNNGSEAAGAAGISPYSIALIKDSTTVRFGNESSSCQMTLAMVPASEVEKLILETRNKE
jgi:ferritin-like metal-binding protein YciE